MKTLYFIRHAKSSWDLPLSDIDRPLALRGLNDAHLMGHELSKVLTQEMVVFVSSSQRTKETFEIIKSYIPHLIKSKEITEDLYTFNASLLLRFIKNLPDKYDSVLIFGHNFAITDVVNSHGSIAIDNVSTCGFVHLKFDINSWTDLKKGTTEKVLFPKSLK